MAINTAGVLHALSLPFRETRKPLQNARNVHCEEQESQMVCARGGSVVDDIPVIIIEGVRAPVSLDKHNKHMKRGFYPLNPAEPLLNLPSLLAGLTNGPKLLTI